MTKPSVIASTKGGHCLTVRMAAACMSEGEVRCIVRSQSGSTSRAGLGRGSVPASAGSQRNVTRTGLCRNVERLGHREAPTCELGLSRRGIHRRAEARLAGPLCLEDLRFRIDPGIEPGEIGGA